MQWRETKRESCKNKMKWFEDERYECDDWIPSSNHIKKVKVTTSDETLELANKLNHAIPDNTPKIEVLRAAIVIAARVLSTFDKYDVSSMENYAKCLLRCEVDNFKNGVLYTE